VHRAADGSWWLGLATPEGAASLHLSAHATDGEVSATAIGPGAQWALTHAPAILGGQDDVGGFTPRHRLIARMWHAHPGWRVPRTGLVFAALLPVVLEAQVAVVEAHRAWRRLVGAIGSSAPGAGAGQAPAVLRVPPAPAVVAGLASWDWHRGGVDGWRRRTLAQAAGRAAALERTAGADHLQADRALRCLPGVGPWTSAQVRVRAHGDPDAVPVGDANLPAAVGLALVGESVDDAGMLELLSPYAGHRYRVIRMVELSGVWPARRAPRAPLRDYRDR
jgi:3-methyladenine DNA glycosylase/8-oxoguanine DNA glycosylase